ncbi:glycoside hydrolase family 15 protein [Rosenbergiella australiborealis]|uniref:glycoside hydrolase family 15 protein n=1 Tax=Rosenbergiella australiborealis TaxID=1544696 RepID=UPI001F4EF2E1|nr:glycoside hydrolase family 15 protein [Rosenbergiella australiborealis]
MKNSQYHSPLRHEGTVGLGDYAAIGEGRSVALIAPDGGIDWWCVPHMDSPALFDRLLDTEIGGYFSLTPVGDYSVKRRYREASNVLETEYTTAEGKALFTESINSNLAGPLPWNELARRIEGKSGNVKFRLTIRFGTQVSTRSPWLETTAQGNVFHIGDLIVMLRCSDDITLVTCQGSYVEAEFTTTPSSRSLCALLVSQCEPLAVPSIEAIDNRIETSHQAWQYWVHHLHYQGDYPQHVIRSALALKFLWFSPTGALAAAATTSLPEGIGGEKNYDYRYAWIRDACLMIKSFVYIGALEDCQAAYSWLSKTIMRHGEELLTCYSLEGDEVPAEEYLDLQGYKDSLPVRKGNNARHQRQLSMYGDMLAVGQLFVQSGHILDLDTSRLLSRLANQCADRWRLKDSGMWELPSLEHYTHSKMACWLALDAAVELVDAGHLESTWRQRWATERDQIAQWIEEHCWSEERQAYRFYADDNGQLDAGLTLVYRYGDRVNKKRMLSTYHAIIDELGHGGPHLYRYSHVEQEESTFVACSFWMVEALAALKENKLAKSNMEQILKTLCDRGNVETFNEMFDVRTGEWRGNLPQGLSHLALICAAQALGKQPLSGK